MLLGAIVAGGVQGASAAITVKLTINDVSGVTVKANYEKVPVQNGENTISVNAYSSLEVTTDEDYILESVIDDGVIKTSWGGSATMYYYTDGDEALVNVVNRKLSDVRTGSFTMDVDDPSKVSASLMQTWKSVGQLVPGVNTVHFIPGVETALSLSAKSGGVPFYQVTKDGTEITGSYGNYEMSVAEGMNVVVKTDFPDISVPVKISYTEGGEGFINKVVVADNEVTNFNDPDFQVHLGDRVQLYGNTADYKFNSMVINGKTENYFYSPYSFVVTKETEILIDATKYTMLPYVVNVDNASAVKVVSGDYYQNNVVELVNGANNLEISSANPRLTITPVDGYVIESVKVDGAVINTSYEGSKQYNVTIDGENTVVDITTSAIVRDQVLVIYAEDLAPFYYSYFQNSERAYLTVEQGYNVINYATFEMPPMQFALYSSLEVNPLQVYLNNALVAPTYENGSSYTLNEFDNYSVLKLYVTTPELYNVTFDIEDGVDAEVVRDMAIPVDTAAGFEALTNTMVTVDTKGQGVVVKVNDAVQTPEEGIVSFAVTGNTNVSIAKDVVDGIEAVGAENAYRVYNLQGIEVLRNADASAVEALPAGIYVVNGKKVVVK